MAWTTGHDQIIAAPAAVSLGEAGGTLAEVGELVEGGAKLRITPIKVDVRLESGAKVERIVGYDIEVEQRLANLSPENLAAIEALHNKLCDYKIKQTVPFGTTNTGREAEVSNCYAYVDSETALAGNEHAGLTLKVSKGGATLSDVLALTNLTV